MMNGMPAQDQSAPAAPDAAPKDESGDLADIAMQVNELLSALMEKIPDAGKPELGQIIQHYQALLQKLGSGESEPAGPPQSVSPEAGSNPNARPM